MLESVFELLFELIFDLLIQVFAEIGFDRRRRAVYDERPRPVLAVLGYALSGAILGGLSLVLFPGHLVRDPSLRAVNLLLAPICGGLIVAWLDRSRRFRHDLHRARFPRARESFVRGFFFVLAVSLVRFFAAK